MKKRNIFIIYDKFYIFTLKSCIYGKSSPSIQLIYASYAKLDSLLLKIGLISSLWITLSLIIDISLIEFILYVNYFLQFYFCSSQLSSVERVVVFV